METTGDISFIDSVLRLAPNDVLILRMIKAFPCPDQLSYLTGISATTLKMIEDGGTTKIPLYLTICAVLWSRLQNLGAEGIKKELRPTKFGYLVKSLRKIDYSERNIIYDDLAYDDGKRIYPSSILVSEIVAMLRKAKGSFTRLNLCDNLISDEGIKVLVEELKTHSLLEKLELRNVDASDYGLRELLPLFSLPKFSILDVVDNHGPGTVTKKLFAESNPKVDVRSGRNYLSDDD